LCVSGFGGIALPEWNPLVIDAPCIAVFLPGESFALSSLAGEPPSRPPKA
jgi:hypothetical protein